MRVQIVKLEAKHLEQLMAQEANKLQCAHVQPGFAETLADSPHSFAAIGETGRVLGCGGIFEIWNGRADTWAVFDKTKGLHGEFLAICRAARAILLDVPFKRIEAAVDVKFSEGHRWAKLLGFVLEGARMRSFSPTGADCSLYALVKGVPS